MICKIIEMEEDIFFLLCVIILRLIVRFIVVLLNLFLIVICWICLIVFGTVLLVFSFLLPLRTTETLGYSLNQLILKNLLTEAHGIL